MFKDKLVINFRKDTVGLGYEKELSRVRVKFSLTSFNGMVYAGIDCVAHDDHGVKIESVNVTVSALAGYGLEMLVKRCFASAEKCVANVDLLDIVVEAEFYVLEKLEGEL